jgi:hypothetical protein
MRLLTKASAALERLRNAEAARSGLAEATALADLQKDLGPRIRPILEVCRQVRMLQEAGIPVSAPTEMSKPLQSLENITARFKEKPEAATLKHAKRWANLLEAVDALRKSCDSSLSRDWARYVDSQLFSGESPEELRSLLAQTPQNSARLRMYTDLYRKFVSLRAVTPTSVEALAQLREYSRQLSEMRFQRDVPENVRVFFEAAATPSGAGLTLLTADVVTWLTNNGHLANFVVRARMN